MAKVTMSFTLDDETDRDLACWLSGLPRRKRSEEIRKALRKSLQVGQERGGATIGDVYQAVRDLERKLQNGAAVAASTVEGDWDEPPEAAASLETLGL